MISLLKKPSAWIPIALSLGIIAMLIFYLTRFGIVHNEDEGTAAHLFQFWLVLEAVMIPFFALRWLPQAPKDAALVLLLQIAAVLAPVAPVFYFHL